MSRLPSNNSSDRRQHHAAEGNCFQAFGLQYGLVTTKPAEKVVQKILGVVVGLRTKCGVDSSVIEFSIQKLEALIGVHLERPERSISSPLESRIPCALCL